MMSFCRVQAYYVPRPRPLHDPARDDAMGWSSPHPPRSRPGRRDAACRWTADAGMVRIP